MSDDWETPKWLLEIAFPDGRFYDPCPIRGKGGLKSEWPVDIPVFINPPYSNPKPWVERAYEHLGPIALLLPCDPSTEWWTYSRRFRVSLIDVRLKFLQSMDRKQRVLDGERITIKRQAPFRRSMGTGTFACSWWWKP